MFEFLFIDLDDTVLDFKKTERTAIAQTLLEAGLDPTQEVCARYSQINSLHWKKLERGELTREQVLTGRFSMLFAEYGITASADKTALCYMQNLSKGHDMLPGARQALEVLQKKYRLFLASNGTASVQASRLKSAQLEKYFEKIFISQDIGFNKPAKEFFDGCFAQIPDFDPKRAIIVGDSLSSDILGGQNAGIATCWVNADGSECTLACKPDYQIQALSELEALLQSL